MLSSFSLAGLLTFLAMHAGGDVRLHGDDCGKARWLFSTITKNYLVACWKARERCIGYVGVGPNGLIFDPPAPPSPTVRCGPAVCVSVPSTRHVWAGWVPKVNRFPSRRARKVSNFYTVWRGRSCGVFYKWSDV